MMSNVKVMIANGRDGFNLGFYPQGIRTMTWENLWRATGLNITSNGTSATNSLGLPGALTFSEIEIWAYTPFGKM